VTTYDTAGRETSKQIIGGGAEVPKVETLYNLSNGFATTQRFVCPGNEPVCDQQSIVATPDALGRVTKYQDADGNNAAVTYNINGQVASFNDGKGIQTYSYDAATGMLVSLSDSMAGTFTASYNADGQMIKRGLPNGLTAETVYDAAGAATDLTYTKVSNCGVSCTWLDFEVARSGSGKILSETGTLGTNKYNYDRAGRLTKAEEKPAGSGCTTRTYAYDQNSNRTTSTSRPPAIGGFCTLSGGTSQSYSYDGADRLEAAGLTYDAFGRITSLPSSYAGGGTLVTSYFSNDMIASQSQGGVTNTFALDAALRQRQRTQGGGLEGTEVFHYAGGSDSPAWTQFGETWTRNIMGIGGELVAVAQSSNPARLQLTNLHGDIVATASANPSDTQFSLTARLDEFGKPLSGAPGRFGWLGSAQRRTEFPSGVIQMGARSYVPAMGRFLSRDPIVGGSASAYDYGNADPVNQFDPSGMKPHDNACDSAFGGLTGCQVWLHIKMWSRRGGRMGVRMIYRSNRVGGISRISFEITYWVDEKDDLYREGFVKMPPPHYLNSYPGIPSSCRGTDPCANNHDGRGTFGCRPGNEYQIQIIFKYRYNVGAEVDQSKVLEVKAQEFCIY
jgi:RHS repeat-associated protein